MIGTLLILHPVTVGNNIVFINISCSFPFWTNLHASILCLNRRSQKIRAEWSRNWSVSVFVFVLKIVQHYFCAMYRHWINLCLTIGITFDQHSSAAVLFTSRFIKMPFCHSRVLFWPFFCFACLHAVLVYRKVFFFIWNTLSKVTLTW